MICPYRLNISYEYINVNSVCVVKEQKEEFPECYECDCPFYDYYGNCTRITDDD